MCQGSFNRVSRVFQGSFKKVSSMFQECFKQVLWVFQEISRGLQGRLKGDSRKFLAGFKGI